MPIYTNIKKTCKQKGISVTKLEADLGFARSTIYKWDTHHHGIPFGRSEGISMRSARLDRRKMTIQNVHRSNGKVLEGEKIGELVSSIINKFSEKELSCDEAKIILQLTIDTLEEFCTVQKVAKDSFGVFLEGHKK